MQLFELQQLHENVVAIQIDSAEQFKFNQLLAKYTVLTSDEENVYLAYPIDEAHTITWREHIAEFQQYLGQDDDFD